MNPPRTSPLDPARDEATGLELPPGLRTPGHRRGTARDPWLLLAVLVGGAVGAATRTAVEDALPHGATSWPWATLAVNVVGALVLGVVATIAFERRPDATYLRPLLGTGLCGGLTTFSTMQLELLRMLDAGEAGLAVGYATASVGLGVLAVVVATRAVRRSAPRNGSDR